MEANKVVEVIDALCEKFGVAIDWTSKNVVPYIEQLCSKFVMYEIITSVVWIVCFVIFTIFGGVMVKIFHKKALADDYDYDCLSSWVATFSWSLLILGTIACIIGIPKQIFDIVECKVFPEKFIFEYISNAIK